MTAYAQRMAYRTKIERNGALQITVGAVLVVLGVAAAANDAAVFAALLIVGGALLVTFGIIRNVRQQPDDAPAEQAPTT